MVIVYAALIVTVYAGIGSEREWNDLEVESYYIHSTGGFRPKSPSYLVVTIDDQPEHIYKYDQSPETLAKRYGTDFNDSVTVDLTARQIVPHFYVKPKALQRLRHRRPDSPTDCAALLREAQGLNQTESRQRCHSYNRLTDYKRRRIRC